MVGPISLETRLQARVSPEIRNSRPNVHEPKAAAAFLPTGECETVTGFLSQAFRTGPAFPQASAGAWHASRGARTLRLRPRSCPFP